MERELTREEKSLLLFFEDCSVNRGSRVETERMNDGDRLIARGWNEEEFVQFGRISHVDWREGFGTHWCHLSDKAWEIAAKLRKARAQRSWEVRNWLKAGEPDERNSDAQNQR